jgi:hypothetical protein
MNNYIMPHALSDRKSLHVTHYGWHDLPQGFVLSFKFTIILSLIKKILDQTMLIFNFLFLLWIEPGLSKVFEKV